MFFEEDAPTLNGFDDDFYAPFDSVESAPRVETITFDPAQLATAIYVGLIMAGKVPLTPKTFGVALLASMCRVVFTFKVPR